MKKYINIFQANFFLPLLLIFAIGLTFQSCEDDDDEGGTPAINYVRLNDPDKADSLITHAFMGSMIAIMGENLQNVKEVWFNDQSAKLNSAFVYNTSLVVTIPNVIPEEVTSKIKLVTNSDTVYYDFGVDVPAPLVSSMLCEYVPAGETAVINGNYFIDDPSSPLKVLFPGNIQGEVKKVELTRIEVVVPEGTSTGQISVKSIYGSTRSSFYFRDDRNFILDWDVLNAAGGWRAGNTGNSDPTGINGNYVRFKGEMAGASGTTWDEDGMSFNLWGTANGRPNVPFYDGDLGGATLKFEIYVVKKWTAGALQMIFTRWSTTGTNKYIGNEELFTPPNDLPRGLWIPWKESGSYQTEGWTTVSVPLSKFTYTPTGGTCSNALTKEMLGGLTFFVYAGGVDGTDCDIHMCIDNIRIVPL